MSLDLLADRLDRGMGPQKTIGQGFIFTQESKKQVLSLNIRRPELAGFVACEKDDAPGFLRIAFKHNALPLVSTDRRWKLSLAGLARLLPIMQPKGQQTQVNRECSYPLITWPKEFALGSFGSYRQFFALCLTNLAFPSPPNIQAGSESGEISSTRPRCKRNTRWQRRANAKLCVAMREVS